MDTVSFWIFKQMCLLAPMIILPISAQSQDAISVASQEMDGRMEVQGIVDVLNIDGTFEFSGNDLRLRISGLELIQNFPEDELLGKHLACYSMFGPASQPISGIIVVRCQFVEGDRTGYVYEHLRDNHLAWEICEPQAGEALCPEELEQIYAAKRLAAETQ